MWTRTEVNPESWTQLTGISYGVIQRINGKMKVSQ